VENRILDRTVVIAVTGASGTIYGQHLLRQAVRHFARIGLVLSRNVPFLAEQELGLQWEPGRPAVEQLLAPWWTEELSEQCAERVCEYALLDFQAPFASGSNAPDAVAIVPCSQDTLARIAAGMSDNLITRAAAVALKERKTLIVAPRETPLSLLHLRNWTALAEAGAVVLPACPGFYHRPQTIEELVQSVTERLLAHLGVPNEARAIRWGKEEG
jgi:4-hydroxy-3-polyprenylbenzoate decarboxylase